MLSEDQFMKLFEGVMDNKRSWELLIRIDENTKNHTKELATHTADDVGKFALAKASMDALHARMDKTKVELSIDQEAIKTKLDKSLEFQNKMLGAILVSAFAVPIIIQVFKG